jgi:uncharacterized repeat protein (TIGR03847 family)
MPQEINLDPVERLTTDAIGQPGQRVFYIQGTSSDSVVSLLVEKIQVQTLAIGVEEFLAEIDSHYPHLSPASSQYNETEMHIHPPVDALFRVGELGLAYDTERDLVCLIAREILAGDMLPENASAVRFWCSRAQIRQMARWAVELTNRGRPICPQCGEPMDPDGHFCPKKNGHKH